MQRKEIEDLLRDKLERARYRYEIAKAEFKLVGTDFPSGLPHPDGTQRINNVGRDLRASREALQAAVTRFHDYIFRGKIPDDLEDTERADRQRGLTIEVISDVLKTMRDANQRGVDFLLADLDVALTFLDVAQTSSNQETVLRNRHNVHKAYDTALDLLTKLKLDAEQQQAIGAKLALLKSGLQAVGYQL